MEACQLRRVCATDQHRDPLLILPKTVNYRQEGSLATRGSTYFLYFDKPLIVWEHGRYPNALLVLRMGVWEVGRVEVQLGKETMHVDRGKPQN